MRPNLWLHMQFVAVPNYFLILAPLVVGCGWVVALVAYALVIRRWPIVAWGGLLVGAAIFQVGLLLTTVAFRVDRRAEVNRDVDAMLLWALFLLTAVPGFLVLVLSWWRVKSAQDELRPSPLDRRLRPGLSRIVGVLLILSAVQACTGLYNYGCWQRAWREQFARNKSAIEQHAESESRQRQSVESRLSAAGDQHEPLASLYGLRNDVLFFEQGAKCLGISKDLIIWDVRQGLELKSIPLKLTDEFLSSVACSDDGDVIAIFTYAKQFRRMVLVTPAGQLGREVMRKDGAGFDFPDEFAVFQLPDQGHRAWVEHVVKKDGDHFRELWLWDLRAGQSLAHIPLPIDRGVALSADGAMLAMLYLSPNEQDRTEIRPGEFRINPGGELQIFDSLTGNVLHRGRLPSVPQTTRNAHRLPVGIATPSLRFAYASVHEVLCCEFDHDGKVQVLHRWPVTSTVEDLRFDAAGERLGVLTEKLVRVHSLIEDRTTDAPLSLPAIPYRVPARLAPDLKTLIQPSPSIFHRFRVSTGQELLRGDPVE